MHGNPLRRLDPGAYALPACWRETLVLVAAACAAWSGVAFGSFQYDDFANVLLDPATTDPAVLAQRLTDGIRPLTRLSYALSHWAFGEWAGGWLFAQLLLHIVTVLAVAALVQLRSGNRIAALLAGAFFAVLPSHGAVVAYVSGRSTGLAACLVLLALLAHEAGIRLNRSTLATTAAMLLFVLACAAKEVAIVFPLLVLAWELTGPARADFRTACRRTIPYLAAALAMLTALVLLVPRYSHLLEFSLEMRSPWQSLLHNVAAAPMTLGLWLQPWGLSVEHAEPAASANWIVGGGVIASMVATAWRVRARHPMATLALLWPLVALLPTHSLIAKTDSITEGPLYLASFGPAAAFGYYAASWIRDATGVTIRRATVATMLAAAIATCAWRCHVWADPVRLWQEAVAVAPQSARAWSNLGIAHVAQGNFTAARAALRASLAIDPSDLHVMFHLEAIASLVPESPFSASTDLSINP